MLHRRTLTTLVEVVFEVITAHLRTTRPVTAETRIADIPAVGADLEVLAGLLSVALGVPIDPAEVEAADTVGELVDRVAAAVQGVQRCRWCGRTDHPDPIRWVTVDLCAACCATPAVAALIDGEQALNIAAALAAEERRETVCLEQALRLVRTMLLEWHQAGQLAGASADDVARWHV